MQMTSREIIRSVIFVLVFWTVVALLFVGLYKITNTIDLTGMIEQLFKIK